MSDDFKFSEVQRSNNFYPTSGCVHFATLPEGCGEVVKMEAKGNYLFIEDVNGKKYRIDSTGKEIVNANLRIVK